MYASIIRDSWQGISGARFRLDLMRGTQSSKRGVSFEQAFDIKDAGYVVMSRVF